jgi:hypothetical protein
MNVPTTPTQMMEDLDLLADHIQQVSARLGSAERQTMREPSSMDTHAVIHRSPREALGSSRQLRSSSKISSPVTPASDRSGREQRGSASNRSSSGSKTTSKKSGKKSSRTSSSNRSTTSGMLSPEGLLKVALLQDKVAADQKQRTLARIGELYLAQSRRSKSPHSSDDDSASSSDQESNASSSQSRAVFYGGYNATYHNANEVSSRQFQNLDSSRVEPQLGYGMEIDRELSHERNDAVVAMPNTGMKKNITMRRSQGRPRDRNSIGGTSKPVENLVSKQLRPREKDVHYAKELAQLPVNTPVKAPVSDEARGGASSSGGIPDFTRRHIPDEMDDPITHAALRNRWTEKKGVEEDMNQALQNGNENEYRVLESHYNALNAQMFSILHSSITRQSGDARSNLPTNDGKLRKPDTHSAMTAAGNRYDGESYVIYLSYQDDVVPWMVWAHMPTSRLIQAAVNVLSGLGLVVARDEIVLFHNNNAMDPKGGYLSDHPVVAEEVVFIFVNPIQGSVLHRKGGKTSMGKSNKCALSMKKENESINGATPGRSVSGENQRLFSTSQDRISHQVDGLHDINSQANFRGRTETTSQSNLANRNINRTLEERNSSEERGSTMNASRAHDKIKQSFKCPRFSGQSKDWKLWNKGFLRFLSIWELAYVVDPNFFDDIPIPDSKIRDNKLVYYLLEDATQNSPLAAAYVRKAPLENGFEAYYTLLDGFVFAGTTTSTILLNELSNFRFKTDETPSEMILRLEELFQDLQMIPGDAAMTFNDTQCINYLLGALRHEPQWDTVASAITSSQIKGELTFRQACDELRLRCEAAKAYQLIDKEVKVRRRVQAYPAITVPNDTDEVPVSTPAFDEAVKALISSVEKRINKGDQSGSVKPEGGKKKGKGGKKEYEKRDCLAKGCTNLSTFPLCGLHYHSVVSGKIPALELRNEFGNAVYNAESKVVEYPAKVPANLLPAVKQ